MFTLCSSLNMCSSLTSLPRRNLIVLSSELKDHYAYVCEVMLPSTDIIVIDQTNIVESMVSQLGDYIWDNIAVIFHGQHDKENNIISIFSRNISTNIDVIELDPGYDDIMKLIGLLRRHLHKDLHIFACDVGGNDGFKYMLTKADKKFNFTGGIYFSTNRTGNPTEGNPTEVDVIDFAKPDWILEMNTKRGLIYETTGSISPLLLYVRDYSRLTF